MALTRTIVTLGRAARDEAGLGVRQPLPRAIVVLPDGQGLAPELIAEVAEELNVKRVESVSDLSGLVDESVVPNFRRLGPKIGSRMPKLKDALAGVDGAAVRAAFDASGTFSIDVDGEAIVLEPDDVEVRARAHEELVLAREGPVAVALDTTLDHELELEGTARELVRRLN